MFKDHVSGYKVTNPKTKTKTKTTTHKLNIITERNLQSDPTNPGGVASPKKRIEPHCLFLVTSLFIMECVCLMTNGRTERKCKAGTYVMIGKLENELWEESWCTTAHLPLGGRTKGIHVTK